MAMIEAVKAGDGVRVRALLDEDLSRARARDESGVSALMLARYYGHDDAVGVLCDAIDDLDVFEAAALGDVGRLAELLDGDPELVNRWSPDGFSPLQLASFFGQGAAVVLLLDRGAETNAASKNGLRVQALHSACASPENGVPGTTALEVARLLLAAGADAKARQERGFTPLHAAAHHGHGELALLLLEHGADRAAVSAEGKTPADVATERGHEDVAALLRS